MLILTKLRSSNQIVFRTRSEHYFNTLFMGNTLTMSFFSVLHSLLLFSWTRSDWLIMNTFFFLLLLLLNFPECFAKRSILWCNYMLWKVSWKTEECEYKSNATCAGERGQEIDSTTLSLLFFCFAMRQSKYSAF